MIEKEYALKLRHQLDGFIFQKARCFYLYSDEEEDIQKCDYNILKSECENLGFHFYKVTESPILQEENKNMKYRDIAYIIYSDYSLTLKSKFWGG